MTYHRRRSGGGGTPRVGGATDFGSIGTGLYSTSYTIHSWDNDHNLGFRAW